MAAASVSSSSFSHDKSDEESLTDRSNFCTAKLNPNNTVVVSVKTRKINANVKGCGRENRLGRLSRAFLSPAVVQSRSLCFFFSKNPFSSLFPSAMLNCKSFSHREKRESLPLRHLTRKNFNDNNFSSSLFTK